MSLSSQHTQSPQSEKQAASSSPESSEAELSSSPLATTLKHFQTLPADAHHQVQRQLAGQQLAQQLGNRRFSQLIQRQDANTTPPPAPRVPLPAPATPRDDPQIRAEREQFMRTSFTASTPRFDLDYKVAPGQDPSSTPIPGAVKVTLKVHITFRDFTRAMMSQEDFRGHRFTPEQIADFRWKDEEKVNFAREFISSVNGVWSSGSTGLNFACTSQPFDDFSAPCNINVEAVDDPAQAHNKMTAQKVPAGAPRFRSFVQGDTSVLDSRDPTEMETHTTFTPQKLWRVAPFDNGKSDIAPVQGLLDGTVLPELRQWQSEVPAAQRGGDTFGPNRTLNIVGRASSTGGTANNRAIGERRATVVAEYLMNALSFNGSITVSSRGETGTGEDADFRRVDVMAVDDRTSGQQVQQNVAAHEAGHMFGLDDEYVDADAQRLIGDKPEHYGDVEAQLGTDAANDTLVANSGNIMSTGGNVQPGHYVMFLNSLESVTGKQWTVRR